MHLDAVADASCVPLPVEPRSAPSLSAFLDDMRPDWHSQWAWDHYADTITALSRRFGLRRLCEIGAGRDPLFTRAQLDALDVELPSTTFRQPNSPAPRRASRQGNRANRLRCDEAGEVVVVPCGDLSPEAYGVLA